MLWILIGNMQKGAIILCGGRSSRMGRDKATLPFGPDQMLQRVVRLVSESVPMQNIVVVAAQSQHLPMLPDKVHVARDPFPERGPMQGLEAGLLATGNSVEAVFVASCDLPLLEPKFIDQMFGRLGSAQIAVTRDDFHYHPLVAVYRPEVLTHVQALLAENLLKLSKLFERAATVSVPVAELQSVDPQLRSLWNLNRPEDYQRALAAAGFAKSLSNQNEE